MADTMSKDEEMAVNVTTNVASNGSKSFGKPVSVNTLSNNLLS